jgi:hypothetical protein
VREGGVRDRLEPADALGRGSLRPHSRILPVKRRSYAWRGRA